MTTYPNGKVPASARTAIDKHGRTMLTVSAKAFLWVTAEVKRLHGWTPEPSDGLSANRTIADQEYLFRQNYTPVYAQSSGKDARNWPGHGVWWRKKGNTVAAAVPGTSNHGYARAIDVQGLGGFTATRFKQFAAVAKKVGFSNTEGASVKEYWHWVHDGKTAPPKPKPEPEDPVTVVKSGPSIKIPSGSAGQKVGTVIRDSGKTAWTNIDFDPDAKKAVNTIVTSEDAPRGGLIDLKGSLSGVPIGATVQVRAYRVDTDSKGVTPDGIKPVTYEIVEREGTDGETKFDLTQTFGKPSPDKPATETRFRTQVQVILPPGSTAKPEIRAARAIISIY